MSKESNDTSLNNIFVGYTPVEFNKTFESKNTVFKHPKLIRTKTYSLPAKPKVIEAEFPSVDNLYSDMVNALVQENELLKALLQDNTVARVSRTSQNLPSYVAKPYLAPVDFGLSNYTFGSSSFLMNIPNFNLGKAFAYPVFRAK